MKAIHSRFATLFFLAFAVVSLTITGCGKKQTEVEWETTVSVSDVPWLQARRGKANVVGFFESLVPLKITRFEPHTIFDGGDKVFVLIKFEATARGKSYSFPNNGHLWQFNATGKVVKYDHVTDTAQMIRLAKGE